MKKGFKQKALKLFQFSFCDFPFNNKNTTQQRQRYENNDEKFTCERARQI